MNDAADVITTLRSLKGVRIWEALAGPNTGSTLSLQAGPLRALARPLTNPRLTPLQQRHEGEIGFLIGCAWRVESETTIICSSRSPGAEMTQGVRELTDKVIAEVDVKELTLDFTLTTFGGIRLAVFCDEVDAGERYDNYSLLLWNRVLIVGPRSVVRWEEAT